MCGKTKKVAGSRRPMETSAGWVPVYCGVGGKLWGRDAVLTAGLYRGSLPRVLTAGPTAGTVTCIFPKERWVLVV